MLGGVAFVAGDALMFPFENVAGQVVVKGLGIPFDQGKIFTVMLGVAFGTGIVVALGQFVSGMQTLARAEAARDFRVTAKTLERGGGTEPVAVGAVQCSVERFVCAGKRTRRNLGEHPCRQAEDHCESC